MQVSVKVDSADLQRAMRKAPQRTQNALQKGINAAGVVFQRQMIQEAPTHDGHLRRSIRIKSGNLKVQVEPTAKYAPYIENGTGPHWVGIRHIEKWANDKGLNPYAVQRSIAQKGTKANPFVQRTFEMKERDAVKAASRIVNRDIKRILN